MRRLSAFVTVLLLVMSCGATLRAQDVPELSWDTDWGMAGYILPNCTLQETQTLVVFFPSPVEIDSLLGLDATIEVTVQYVRGPDDWWRFDSGCHQGGLSVTTEIPEGASNPWGAGSPWEGPATTSLSIEYPTPHHEETLRLRFDVSIQATPSMAQALTKGQMYHAFRLQFEPADVSCEGCRLSACFQVLPGLTLRHSKGVTVLHEVDYRSEAAWLQFAPCIAPFSIDESSWGRVKSIYR